MIRALIALALLSTSAMANGSSLYYLANDAFEGKNEASGIVGPFEGKAACELLRADAERTGQYHGVCLKLQDRPKRDPRCDGAGRYEAMRDGDFSGQGTGHACR